MALHDVTLPIPYSYRTRRNLTATVTQFKADSGDVMTSPLKRVLFGFGLTFTEIESSDSAKLRAFHFCRGGPRNPFRFRDLLDFSSAPNGIDLPTMTDQKVIAVTVEAVTKYYLAKNYGLFDRVIKLPHGDVILSDGGVAVSGATVNGLTGEVTGHTPTGDFRWGGTFDIPCRYELNPPTTTYVDWNADTVDADIVEVLEELT